MSEMRNELEASARKLFPGWAEARDADLAWSRIAELGWLMAGVPEELGGLGLDRADQAVIFAELGRALVPGPVLAQIVAIEALVGSGEGEAHAELLENAMAGTVITAPLTTGHGGDGGFPDADRAEYALLRSHEEVALIALEGASITRRETWDSSRRLFDVTPANGARRIVLARDTNAAELSDRLDGLLCLALAGDSLGGAAAVLGLTIDYLATRKQFGRPIGMFQALKHRVADLKCALDTAEALYRARSESPADRIALGSVKAHCCQVYKQVAEEAIQLHGGIGLTVELPVHLFLKRAFLNCELGRNADHWNELAGRAALARPAT